MLHIVRHFSTSENEGNIMCSSKDSFLSKNATAEKNKLMDYFKNKEIDCILTSDSIRAVQTAEAISSICKTQLILTSNLNERKVSDFYSNTSIEELIAKRKLMGHFFSDPTQDWNNEIGRASCRERV